MSRFVVGSCVLLVHAPYSALPDAAHSHPRPCLAQHRPRGDSTRKHIAPPQPQEVPSGPLQGPFGSQLPTRTPLEAPPKKKYTAWGVKNGARHKQAAMRAAAAAAPPQCCQGAPFCPGQAPDRAVVPYDTCYYCRHIHGSFGGSDAQGVPRKGNTLLERRGGAQCYS